MSNIPAPVIAAHKLVRELKNHMDEQGAIYDSGIEIIARALAEGAETARREQMEQDCKAVCEWCSEGVDINTDPDGVYFHSVPLVGGLPRVPTCRASGIRAAIESVEAKRESE